MTDSILNPTDVAVTVIAKDGTYVVEDLPDLIFDNCADKKPNGPKYKIRFNVLNPDGSDYCFDDRKHPFAVENKVPPVKRGKPADDICKVDQVTHEGRTLIVTNDNIDKRTLKYTLHLVSKSGLESLTYDPIMSNQNGANLYQDRRIKLVLGVLAGIVGATALLATLAFKSTDD